MCVVDWRRHKKQFQYKKELSACRMPPSEEYLTRLKRFHEDHPDLSYNEARARFKLVRRQEAHDRKKEAKEAKTRAKKHQPGVDRSVDTSASSDASSSRDEDDDVTGRSDEREQTHRGKHEQTHRGKHEQTHRGKHEQKHQRKRTRPPVRVRGDRWVVVHERPSGRSLGDGAVHRMFESFLREPRMYVNVERDGDAETRATIRASLGGDAGSARELMSDDYIGPLTDNNGTECFYVPMQTAGLEPLTKNAGEAVKNITIRALVRGSFSKNWREGGGVFREVQDALFPPVERRSLGGDDVQARNRVIVRNVTPYMRKGICVALKSHPRARSNVKRIVEEVLGGPSDDVDRNKEWDLSPMHTYMEAYERLGIPPSIVREKKCDMKEMSSILDEVIAEDDRYVERRAATEKKYSERKLEARHRALVRELIARGVPATQLAHHPELEQYHPRRVADSTSRIVQRDDRLVDDAD